MNKTSLTRRLLAGAAGLVIGAAGAVALTAPAQAVQGPETFGFQKSSVEFVDDCEGTTVLIESGKFLPAYKWTITVDGDEAWSEWLKKGESAEVPVTGEEIEVDFKGSPKRDWPAPHSWTPPEDCDEPEEPEEPETPLEGTVEWEFDCETIVLTISNETEEDVDFTVAPSEGDAVDVTVGGGETSEEVSFPSAEGLTIDLLVDGESVLDGELIEITSEDWAALECDGGQGGEDEDDQLPVTGSSTMLIAGGALALLVAGGGLFLLARRRRVTFTA